MRSLVRFGLRQTVLMNVVFVATVIFAAIWALPRLPVDRYPNFNFGEATITVRWPGASPQDVERLVVKVLEDAIRGMDDLEYVRSAAIAGQGEINVKFIDDTAYEKLYEELRLRVLAAQNRLPSANGKPLTPIFALVETDQWLPVLQVSVVPDGATPVARRQLTLLSKELQTRLEGLPGVKRVDLWGDESEQFVVGLDPVALRRHGVSPGEVVAALQSSGISLPGGVLGTAAGERPLRIDGRFQDREAILAVAVRRDGNGGLLRVADLIDAQATGPVSFDGGTRITLDGRDAVACKVLKDPTADARAVKALVEEALGAFRTAHPDGGFRTVISLDSTIPISDSISVLGSNLLQGFALVLIVLTAILGLRAASLSLSGMIFAFLGTLIYFKLTGSSLNELSLLGFVIVVGILVDDAVVVLDNIMRHREEGKPLDRALIDGATEVFWPVVASVATTMASFLPLLMMTGVVGQFFSLVPTAVVVALGLSLIESLLMLPGHVQALDRVLGPPRIRQRSSEEAVLGYLKERSLVGTLARRYDGLLTWGLRRPWTSVTLTGVLFLLAIGVLAQSAAAPFIGMRPLLKLEFFPSDASIVEARVTMPVGSTLAQTDATVREISAYVAAKGPGQSAAVQGIAGLTVDSTYKPQWGSQYGMLQIEVAGRETRTFDDPAAWIEGLRKELTDRFQKDGVRLTVQAGQGGPPTGLPVNVRLAGLDDPMVRRAARDLAAWMEGAATDPQHPLRGVVDVAVTGDRRGPILSFQPDRDRLARLGIGEPEAAAFAASLVEGSYTGDLRRSDDDIPVTVRLSRPAMAADLAVADAVPLRSLPDGQVVRLADVGRLTLTEEPTELIRRDFVRTLTVTALLAADSPINAFQANSIVQRWVAERQASYPGVVLGFGGEAESTGRTYASLGLAFAVSLFAIYTILAMQFRNYVQPLLIMSSIVFSITGVVLVMGVFGALVQAGGGLVRAERALFTVNSFIAIVALTGMVVNNAIILIDFINNRRAEGRALLEVLRESGHLRLRAVLLTTTTTIAGFLPTAIGIPEFNLTWSPMATAFVAGLMLSTLLTLLVVPVLYLLMERHPRLSLVASLVTGGLALSGFAALVW